MELSIIRIHLSRQFSLEKQRSGWLSKIGNHRLSNISRILHQYLTTNQQADSRSSRSLRSYSSRIPADACIRTNKTSRDIIFCTSRSNHIESTISPGLEP